jgi:lysophospholipase L1-like esterase
VYYIEGDSQSDVRMPYVWASALWGYNLAIAQGQSWNNMAVSGSNVVDVYDRVRANLPMANPLGNDRFFLMIGVNDSNPSYPPKNLTPQTYRTYLDLVMHHVTVTKQMNMTFLTWCPPLNSSHLLVSRDYLREARESAAAHDVPVIDIFAHWCEWRKTLGDAVVDGLYADPANDPLHENAAGHHQIMTICRYPWYQHAL